MASDQPTTTLVDLETNPYPVYARLRDRDPVSWVPEAGQWLVAGWHDVNAVLSDPERFTSEQPASPMLNLCGGTPMLFRDGEEHRDLRAAFAVGLGIGPSVGPSISPSVGSGVGSGIAERVDAIARPIAKRIADDVFAAGRADLVADYFEPIAAMAVAGLLGIGPGGADTLRRWGNALARVTNNLGRDRSVDDNAVAAMAEDAAVAVVVERLSDQPDGSVLSHLLHANRDPGCARPDTLPVLKHLALSVIEPAWLAAWTLMSLWDDPDQLDDVLLDRSLLDAAVYEGLRWSGPVGTLARRTTRAVSLGGRELPANSVLAVAIASANRDESVFAEPDRFDVHRAPRPHVGFGAGPHQCPAHPLVVAIAGAALDILFHRMPDARPAPGWRPAPHGWRLRLPGPLDVVWDASARRSSGLAGRDDRRHSDAVASPWRKA